MGEKIWFHPWCECNISGKWIACDAVFDKEIYNAAIKNGIFTKEKEPIQQAHGQASETVISRNNPENMYRIFFRSSFD
jgi:hypothetical protein